MIGPPFDAYHEIWATDFEFHQPDGERPNVICMVAMELLSGRVIRLWHDSLDSPPFSMGPETLYVGFYASAEIGCHLELGWPLPARVVDLYPEFRCRFNGLTVPWGHGLLGALKCFGLVGIDSTEKAEMRDLAMRGGPFSAEEKRSLLDYCQSDVQALGDLFKRMCADLDLPAALMRGRYMKSVARMERRGIPIDTSTLEGLRSHWPEIRSLLIDEVDESYGVYEHTVFKSERFAQYLDRHGISWPRLASGRLALDDATFKERTQAHPRLRRLRELRRALSELRLSRLAVGSDGRNRCMLSAFGTKTGRNAPSSSRFLFGWPRWARGLMQPEPGTAVAYIDYEQQEFGIAAALSEDAAMIDAYSTGDPYLSFARQAGSVPLDATKATHPHEREQFKVCALAVLYGMGHTSLARALESPEARARELLELHRRTYPGFWSWVEDIVEHAMLGCRLQTRLGWWNRAGVSANPRSFANFPMQANGAEILRLACSLTTEAGIKVCAPVHDALFVEAPIERIQEVVQRTQSLMAEAAGVVLGGFELRTDVEVVTWPGRFLDDKGRDMWNRVIRILERVSSNTPPDDPAQPTRPSTRSVSLDPSWLP